MLFKNAVPLVLLRRFFKKKTNLPPETKAGKLDREYQEEGPSGLKRGTVGLGSKKLGAVTVKRLGVT